MSEEVKVAAEKLSELTAEQQELAAKVAGAYIEGLVKGMSMAQDQSAGQSNAEQPA